MNKKYIDFVPVKKNTQRVVKEGTVRREGQVFGDGAVHSIQQTETIRQIQRTTKIIDDKVMVGEVGFARKTGPGVVTPPKFINTQTINKAPLSKGMAANIRSAAPKADLSVAPKVEERGDLEIKKAKATKVGSKEKRAASSVERGENIQVKRDVANYTVPKTPFINQANLSKRPLSKNVYHKPEELPLETVAPDKNVTIVSEPQKESKVGTVVGVIITIILGVVAGTVAFLLLPK